MLCLVSPPNPLDQTGAREAFLELDQHHLPACPTNGHGSRDLILRVVRSFDEHVGEKTLDQRGWSVLIKYRHGVDESQSSKDLSPVRLGLKGPPRPLKSPRGLVGVHGHDQEIAVAASRPQ